MTVRLWSTSTGLEPSDLAPGRDLVLDLDARHGTLAPEGVYAMDALPPEERFDVDLLAVSALDAWRAEVEEALTLDGVRWAWIWEHELYRVANPAVSAACALRASLRATDAGSVELMDLDPWTEAVARSVGEHLGLTVTRNPGARDAQQLTERPNRLPPLRRLRRGAVDALTGLGAPTLLRRDSLLIRAYWPLTDVVDRLIEMPGARPAISLENRPEGARRQVRAALEGGWLGSPTPLDRRRVRDLVPPALAAVDAAPGLRADGMDLGAAVRPGFQAMIGRRLVTDASRARSLRRGLRAGRPARVLGNNDAEPTERLVGQLAREAGVPSLLVCHGAYLLPQALRDLEQCEEAVLWSRAVAPRMTWREGAIHEVGYPRDQEPAAARRLKPGARPHVAVLGQLGVNLTCTIDKRLTVRSYLTTIGAVLDRFPGARVVMRPHPAESRATHELVLKEFAGSDVTLDGQTPIGTLAGEVDLLVGGTSTATLQAALAGAQVAVLNLTGFEWRWPLGGDTSVAVARSRAELDAVLDRFASDGELPGRSDLLDALGVHGGDTVGRIAGMALRREPVPAAVPPPSERPEVRA